MSIALTDLYWAAGFLEGEGSFVTWTGKKQHYFAATAVQVQKEPLLRLQGLFGGGLTLRQARTKNSRPCWVWRVFGSTAAGLMMTLFSIMSPKRQQQIKDALSVWRKMRVPFQDRPLCIRGHRFNRVSKKGWRYCDTCRALSRKRAA